MEAVTPLIEGGGQYEIQGNVINMSFNSLFSINNYNCILKKVFMC